MLEPFVWDFARFKETEFLEEHCGNAVEGCAFLLLNSREGCAGVEGLGWEDDSGAVGCCGHVA